MSVFDTSKIRRHNTQLAVAEATKAAEDDAVAHTVVGNVSKGECHKTSTLATCMACCDLNEACAGITFAADSTCELLSERCIPMGANAANHTFASGTVYYTRTRAHPPMLYAKGCEDEVVNDDPYGYTCQDGMVEAAKAWGGSCTPDTCPDKIPHTSDNDKQLCAIKCDEEPRCVGFDVMTTAQEDACRLVPANTPRLSGTGNWNPGNRQYCKRN